MESHVQWRSSSSSWSSYRQEQCGRHHLQSPRRHRQHGQKHTGTGQLGKSRTWAGSSSSCWPWGWGEPQWAGRAAPQGQHTTHYKLTPDGDGLKIKGSIAQFLLDVLIRSSFSLMSLWWWRSIHAQCRYSSGSWSAHVQPAQSLHSMVATIANKQLSAVTKQSPRIQKYSNEVIVSHTALVVDNGWAALVVPLLVDPHLLATILHGGCDHGRVWWRNPLATLCWVKSPPTQIILFVDNVTIINVFLMSILNFSVNIAGLIVQLLSQGWQVLVHSASIWHNAKHCSKVFLWIVCDFSHAAILDCL